MIKGKPFDHFRAKREENFCNQYQLEHAKRAIPNDKRKTFKLIFLREARKNLFASKTQLEHA